MNNKQNVTNNKFGRVLAVPSLWELYPGICLTTEEKARKNLSQGNQRDSKYTHYQDTHTLQNPPIHTYTHITKQFKTTTVQIKTNTVQDIPKRNNHNIIKFPQYKVTVMHIAPVPTRNSP
jgi:hypothetical protein